MGKNLLWAVVRDPSAAKSGKRKSLRNNGLWWPSWSGRWNPDLKRGQLGTPQNPSLALTSPPEAHLDPVTWRERMAASGPHSLHSYAIYTTFVSPLRRPDRICCGAVTQDLHHRTRDVKCMRKMSNVHWTHKSNFWKPLLAGLNSGELGPRPSIYSVVFVVWWNLWMRKIFPGDLLLTPRFKGWTQGVGGM